MEKTKGRGRNHDVTDDVHRIQRVFESAQLGLKNLCLGKNNSIPFKNNCVEKRNVLASIVIQLLIHFYMIFMKFAMTLGLS